MKTSTARRPEAFLTNSHAYSTLALRTELVTNFLHESDKFVSGSLILLAPE